MKAEDFAGSQRASTKMASRLNAEEKQPTVTWLSSAADYQEMF